MLALLCFVILPLGFGAPAWADCHEASGPDPEESAQDIGEEVASADPDDETPAPDPLAASPAIKPEDLRTKTPGDIKALAERLGQLTTVPAAAEAGVDPHGTEVSPEPSGPLRPALDLHVSRCDSSAYEVTVQVMVIAPYESFGPARFGSSEEEVVTAMGQPDYALEKRYSYGHFKVYFDVYGCDCAELFSSRDEVVPVVDSDLRLVGDLDVVVQALHQRGYETRPGPEQLPNVVLDVLCDALGIRLWHATEEIIGIESVAAFRRDVYERMFQPQKGLS